MTKTTTSPHAFRPLRLWDMRRNGRCRHCFLPMYAHPVHAWVPARPMGDKRKPEVSWAVLHGEEEHGGSES